MGFDDGNHFDEQFKTVNVGEFFDFVSAPKKKKKSDKCPVCGYTPKQFLETGFLGCTECYKYLYDTVEPAILRLFGKTEHICNDYEPASKMVKAKQNSSQKVLCSTDELTKLKNELNLAVINEDYEKAAYLKNKINRLKGEING